MSAYTVEQLDTPAGPRWFVVNASAPGNTRKYLASFETEAEAEAETAERNRPARAGRGQCRAVCGSGGVERT